VVPTTASGHSALGAVTADRRRSFSLACGEHAPPRFKKASDHVDVAVFNDAFQKLEAQCRKALGDAARIERKVGMRFRQQVHEIEINVPAKVLEGGDIDKLVETFEETYERIYGKGTALRMSGVEFTVLRTEAISPVTKPAPAPLPNTGAKVEATSTRKVYFYQLGFRDTQIYRSEALGPGTSIAGPAIVERPDTTIVVGPGQRLDVEPFGNMIITLNAGSH
jgi:N-methylhydantoinase A